MKQKLTDQEADKEITKFHIQLLKNVINIIEINQLSVLEVRDNEEGDNELFEFHNGSIAFGNVIINEINNEIKQIKKERKR